MNSKSERGRWGIHFKENTKVRVPVRPFLNFTQKDLRLSDKKLKVFRREQAVQVFFFTPQAFNQKSLFHCLKLIEKVVFRRKKIPRQSVRKYGCPQGSARDHYRTGRTKPTKLLTMLRRHSVLTNVKLRLTNSAIKIIIFSPYRECLQKDETLNDAFHGIAGEAECAGKVSLTLTIATGRNSRRQASWDERAVSRRTRRSCRS